MGFNSQAQWLHGADVQPLAARRSHSGVGLLTGLHFPGLRLLRAGKLSSALVLLAPGFKA